MTLVEALILVAVGGLTGFMNVISAGGSMITLPVLMFMGLDSATANGTNRVGIVLQNATAVTRFRKAGHKDVRLALKLSIPAVLGSLLGAWLATQVGDALFQWILIVVMVGCSILMVMPQPKNLRTEPLKDSHLTPAVYVAMLVIGFYGGFIQVAVGILFIVMLYRLLKIDLVQVNILKVLIVLVYMVPALGVFIYSGHVAWSYGLVLAVGSMLGAWMAARVTLSPDGAKWIQRFTLAVIVIIIVKLIIDLV